MPADEHLSGMQFVFHQANPREMGGVSHHTVEAWPAEHAGEEWAQARPEERSRWEGSSVDPGIRPVSSLSWSHQTGEIKGVFTDPEHQRQGIASGLFQEGHRLAAATRGVRPPKHSPHRTTSGDAWARSVGGRIPPKKA